jgi:hypothetical protein
MKTQRWLDLVLVCCVIALIPACRLFETREVNEGLVLTVKENNTRRESLVCHPTTFSQYTSVDGVITAGFELDVHVQELDGENCGIVNFTCVTGGTSSQKRVCVGSGPVDTGCRTMSGQPILMEANRVVGR